MKYLVKETGRQAFSVRFLYLFVYVLGCVYCYCIRGIRDQNFLCPCFCFSCCLWVSFETPYQDLRLVGLSGVICYLQKKLIDVVGVGEGRVFYNPVISFQSFSEPVSLSMTFISASPLPSPHIELVRKGEGDGIEVEYFLIWEVR